MKDQNFMRGLSYRTAGWFAIASGAIGIIAFIFSRSASLTRTSHDVGVILQFILLMPVVFAVFKLLQQSNPSMGRTTLNVGIGALFFTVLLILLTFPKILVDDLYAIPQGVFGLWLIIVNWRMNGNPLLKWLGIVAGLGLALVATFPVGYAILVDPVYIFHIPAIEATNHDTPANRFLHKIIWVGSLMYELPLPVWTILFGTKLLQEKK